MSPEGRLLFSWYKMNFVNSLKDVKAKSQVNPGLMLLRLKKAPFLYVLGKIVAVDQFIGNSDRFNAMGELVNPGNLLFPNQGHAHSGWPGLFRSTRPGCESD